MTFARGDRVRVLPFNEAATVRGVEMYAGVVAYYAVRCDGDDSDIAVTPNEVAPLVGVGP